jgi:NhaA family Na+:H+ antiporter
MATTSKSVFSAESAPGLVLMAAALLAMAIANSPWAPHYLAFLDITMVVRVGDFDITKPLLLWINDGLMAVFFFHVGLELKRELIEGELSRMSQALLPVAAAVGGMAVPALVYAGFNTGDALALRGWAIPAATDIAFALGVLALLGSRVPRGLKVFLLTVAIADDIGAIIIIALFYSTTPPISALLFAGAALVLLMLLNRAGVTRISPYLLIGLVLWAAVLKSGVHATIAGVLLAFTVPLRSASHTTSPARQLERDLHGPVVFGVLPLFAFANAGVSFHGMTLIDVAHPITLGIALGLFIGKQAGILSVTALLVALRVARLPQGATWLSFYGVAILTGIGFTMSLFIGSLAFHDGLAAKPAVDERLGILLGSALSAGAGYVVLRAVSRKTL